MGIELDNGKPDRRPPRPGEPLRDGNNNYKMTTEDGLLRSFTRATTVAGSLDDNYKLDQWHSMMVAKGLGLRSDLVDLAAGHDVDDDRSVFEGLIKEAHSAAEVSASANTGTALHRFTEMWDNGEPLAAIPAQWHRHVMAWSDTLAAEGLEVVAVEACVGLDKPRIGGLIDRIVRTTQEIVVEFKDRTIVIPPGTLLIGDLKTGKRMDFGRLKFTIQVTIYANHTFVWEVDHDHEHGGTRGGRFDVDLEVALIIHLPSGDPDANAYVHWVDLTAGYESFLGALQARSLRSRSKHMITDGKVHASAEPVGFQPGDHIGSIEAPQPEPEPEPNPLVAKGLWLRDRMEAIAHHGGAQAVADLRYRWPLVDHVTGSPVGLPVEPTAEQIDAVAVVLSEIEAHYQVGFPPAPPDEATPETSWLTQITRPNHGGV